MSGTATTKPPKNNAEWARNTEKRLNQTEHPTSQRVGDWVISTHPDSGALIASYVSGGSVVLANPPDPSADADAVLTEQQPFIKVERQTTQTEDRGSSHLVMWDSVMYQTEDWGFVPTASDLVIPEDGMYLCLFHIGFVVSTSSVNKGMFMIDGVVKMVQEFEPGVAHWVNLYMADTFSLNAGQVVSCAAYVSGSGTFGFGAPSSDPTVFTSLSLVKMSEDSDG